MSARGRGQDNNTAFHKSTYALTTLIKFAGLLIALNELIVRSEPRSIGLAIAAFMMAGAQVSEEVLIGLLDSFLGNRKRES